MENYFKILNIIDLNWIKLFHLFYFNKLYTIIEYIKTIEIPFIFRKSARDLTTLVSVSSHQKYIFILWTFKQYKIDILYIAQAATHKTLPLPPRSHDYIQSINIKVLASTITPAATAAPPHTPLRYTQAAISLHFIDTHKKKKYAVSVDMFANQESIFLISSAYIFLYILKNRSRANLLPQRLYSIKS